MRKDVKNHTINHRKIPNFHQKSHKIPRFSHEVTMVLHGQWHANNTKWTKRSTWNYCINNYYQKMRKTFQNTKSNLSYLRHFEQKITYSHWFLTRVTMVFTGNNMEFIWIFEQIKHHQITSTKSIQKWENISNMSNDTR